MSEQITTAEEYREAYEGWKAQGQAMHGVLLDLWRAVTPDSEHRTFGDDIEAVRSSVVAALRSTSPATVEAAARVICGADPGHMVLWPLQGETTYCGMCYGDAQALADAGLLAGVVTDAMVEKADRARVESIVGHPISDARREATRSEVEVAGTRAALLAAHEGGVGGRG